MFVFSRSNSLNLNNNQKINENTLNNKENILLETNNNINKNNENSLNPFKGCKSLQRTPPKINEDNKKVNHIIDNEIEIQIKKKNIEIVKEVKSQKVSQPVFEERFEKNIMKEIPVVSFPSQSNQNNVIQQNRFYDIDNQLNLANELIEKYRSQEDMIKLRQQMRFHEMSNINSEKYVIIEEPKVVFQPPTQFQESNNVNFDQSPVFETLDESPIKVDKQELKVYESPINFDHDNEFNSFSESPIETKLNNIHSIIEDYHNSPETEVITEVKRKKRVPKQLTPEKYVDLGVPYLIPKGMSFVPLKSAASVKLIGSAPKSPSLRNIECSLEKKVQIKSTKLSEQKKKQPTKRKKENTKNVDQNDQSTPIKSPPLKQSKQKKQSNNIITESNNSGYLLFCNFVHDDALNIIKKSTKGKKTSESTNQVNLDAVLNQMWNILTESERLEWNNKVQNIQPEENNIKLLSNDQLSDSSNENKSKKETKSNKSTTSKQKNNKETKKTKSKVTKNIKNKDKDKEKEVKNKKVQDKMEKKDKNDSIIDSEITEENKVTIIDPVEEHFNRVEENSKYLFFN